MESLKLLREYLYRSLASLDREIKITENYIDEGNELVVIADKIISKINKQEYGFEIEDINKIKAIFGKDTRTVAELDRFIEANEIITLLKENDILLPQKELAIRAIQSCKDLLDGIRNNLDISLHKEKIKLAENVLLKQRFLNYINSFNENGVVAPIDKDNLKDFNSYVLESIKDESVAYEIIILFSKFNVNYYENLYLKEINIAKLQTLKNTRTVSEEIKKENEQADSDLNYGELGKNTGESINSFKLDILDEEELNIYNAIDEIISMHDDKINGFEFETIDVLNNDNYHNREKTYKTWIKSNKFYLVCYDLKNNILNHITLENKKEILRLCKFVINKFKVEKQELKLRSDKFLSEFPSLEEEELCNIESYLREYETLLSGIDENEKIFLSSYRDAIDLENNLPENLEKLKINVDDVYFILLEKMRELYNLYEDDWKASRDLYLGSDVNFDDLDMLKSDFENSIMILRSILKLIDDCVNYIDKKEENEDEEKVEIIEPDINGLIFLDNEGILNDEDEILKYGDVAVRSAKRCLKILSVKDIEQLRTGNSRKFKVSIDKKNELDYRRYKSGTGRAIFKVMPITEENRKFLVDNGYIASNGNVLMVIGFGSKYGGKNLVYANTESRLKINYEKFKSIIDIFSNKLTDKTKMEMIDLLDDGKQVMARIEDDYDFSHQIGGKNSKERRS